MRRGKEPHLVDTILAPHDDRPLHAEHPRGFRHGPAGILAADAEESATCIRSVLDGELGPRRDIVVLNAAALLWAAGRATDLIEASQQAMAAIDSGQARSVLERLLMASHASET